MVVLKFSNFFPPKSNEDFKITIPRENYQVAHIYGNKSDEYIRHI